MSVEPSSVTVDAEQLRREIQVKYEEVATRPDGIYHFFTGRKAAEHVGIRFDRMSMCCAMFHRSEVHVLPAEAEAA